MNVKQVFRVSVRSVVFFLALLPLPLCAQNAVTVLYSTPDLSNGSFAWAVTTLNASGAAGAITFANPTGPQLTVTVPAITQSVTFEGGGLFLTGQNNAEAQLLFQQSFIQNNTFSLTNNGAFSAGLDASVTAASWSTGLAVNATLQGGNGAGVNTVGGSGATGQNGGNAAVTAGTWTLGNTTQVLGGNGGSVTDTGGSGDLGGVGGSAFVTTGSLIEADNVLQISGGLGGSVTDLGSTTSSRGGDGGAVLVQSSLVSIGNFTTVTLSGGTGGAGVTGGNGGGATLAAGSVSVVSGLNVHAGDGGAGVSVGGSGGDASLTFGQLTQSAVSRYTFVTGGNGVAGGSTGGNGGNASVDGNSVSLTNNSGFQVTGGNGGSGAVAGGAGGTASVSLTSLSGTSNAFVTLSGGNGGAGGAGSTAGAGGLGGGTNLNLGTLSVSGSNQVILGGGAGGAGGNNTGLGAGGTGGSAGSLSVTLGTLTLTTGSGLTLAGNTGGNGGNSTGGVGGAGGNGGSSDLAIGSVTLSAGNFLIVTGGTGGTGGTGATSGVNGAEGTAYVTIGDLEGGGAVSLSGTGAQLLLSTGTFFGTIEGNAALEKTGSGALTLQGANTYSGNTYVTNGTLAVDTGATPGTGTITNLAVLDYIHSATAQNTLINDHIVNFMNNSTGGSAQIVNNVGAFVDFSPNNASTVAGGAMTVGSIAGAGTYELGQVDLITGGNNLSTTVTGLVTDGGGSGGTGASLTKVGTGTLTLLTNNAYSGGTNIDGGTLAVGNGNSLGPTGSVAVNGGVLSTAGLPLTFAVGGNYTQGSNGTLRIGLGGAGASSQDKVIVTGSASLNGTLDVSSYGSLSAFPVGSTAVVMLGPSFSGTFQQVNENINGFRLLPIYATDGLGLESINPSFQSSGTTPNQQTIGADLDRIVFNPKFEFLMNSLGTLSNTALQTAYSQLSPEDFTAAYQAGFEGALARTALVDQRLSQFMADADNTAWLPGFSNAGTARFAGNLPAAKEAAMTPHPASPWGGFISGDGGFFNVTGDSNAAGYKVSTFGLTGAGADVRLSREMAAGLMVGYARTDVTLGTGGTLTADGGQLGLYGLFYSEGFYAGALAEGGINSYSTQRLAYGGTATGSTQGSQWDGALELGYQFKAGQVKIGPLVSAQYSSVGMNGFTEQGSQAPLTVPNQSENSLLSRLGIRAGSQWSLGHDAALIPSLQLAWEHEYNNQGGSYQAGFGTGDSFTVAGPQVGQDGLAAGAGLGLTFAKSSSVFLDYQGEFGRTNLNSSQLGGGVRVGF